MDNCIVHTIGDVSNGLSWGLDYSKPRVWVQCIKCGLCRWVQVQTTKEGSYTGLCGKCYRKSRKGVRRKKAKCRWVTKTGYVMIRVYPEDFFHPMAGNNGYVAEHRLVVAKDLGRSLHRWEIVHHINGNKGDNRRENLQLVSNARHLQITILEERIKFLEKLLAEANIRFNFRNEPEV